MKLSEQLPKVKEEITEFSTTRKAAFQSGSNTLFYDQHLVKKKEEFETLQKEQEMFFDRFRFKVEASRKL